MCIMITKSFTRLLLLAVLVSVVSSCSTAHDFTIEIREPAKITFPPDVSNIVVVNNAVVPENNDLETDYSFNNKESYASATLNFDSAIWVSVATLAKGIAAEEFFSDVMVHLEPIRLDNACMEILQIPADIRRAIYTTTGADAIISVDRCLFRYVQKIDKIDVGYEYSPHYIFVNAKAEANFTYSIYLRDRANPLTTFVLEDSLFYSSQVIGDSTLIYKTIPNELIVETAAYMAEKAIPYFIPTWKEVNRVLYSSPESRMKEARAYAKANKWNTAKEIWLQLYSQENKPSVQARLANNLAIVSEVQDDLTQSLEWAQKAETLFQGNKKETDWITSYIASLRERITNNLLLDKQLNNK